MSNSLEVKEGGLYSDWLKCEELYDISQPEPPCLRLVWNCLLNRELDVHWLKTRCTIVQRRDVQPSVHWVYIVQLTIKKVTSRQIVTSAQLMKYRVNCLGCTLYTVHCTLHRYCSVCIVQSERLSANLNCTLKVRTTIKEIFQKIFHALSSIKTIGLHVGTTKI